MTIVHRRTHSIFVAVTAALGAVALSGALGA